MNHLNAASLPFPTKTEESGSANGNTDNAAAASGTSSSALYKLLQDLGLTATAQALCEELQRQRASNPTTTATTAVAAVSKFHSREASAVAKSPANVSVSTTAASRSAASPIPPTVTEEVLGEQQPLSLESTNNTTIKSVSAASLPTPTAALAKSACSPFSVVSCSNVLYNSATSPNDGCASAMATLAACAVEPMLAVATKKSNTLALTSVADIEVALRFLWAQEVKTVKKTNFTGVEDFRISSLIAHAALCELHIAEHVFLQEYHLAQANSSVASEVTAALHDAQADVVEYALQLVAALQELLAVTGASASAVQVGTSSNGENCNNGATATATTTTPEDALGRCATVARIHITALAWLRNTECVLSWLLRRQTNFDAQPESRNAEQRHPPPPQRKRRCLEQPTSSDDSHLSTNGGVSRSLPNTNCREAVGTGAASKPPKSSSLHAVVRLPTSVRLAMAAQRTKLLLTLMTALAHNGEHSIVCTVLRASATNQNSASRANSIDQKALSKAEDATNNSTDMLHRWWTSRCAMQAQLLLQTAHHLRSLFPSASTTLSGTEPLAAAASAVSAFCSGNAFGSQIHTFIALLDTQARQLLLSPTSLTNVESKNLPPVSAQSLQQQQQRRMVLTVSLFKALEGEQVERAAWLDRFILNITSSTSVRLPESLSTVTAEAIYSPNASLGSPGARSETSPAGSPTWTLPLTNPLPPPAPAVPTAVPSTSPAATTVTSTAARTAARVLRWQPHFTHLLTTIATGRWQALSNTLSVEHPCSHYNRTRLNLMHALSHAQELLRLQPRRPVAANGCEYVAHPGLNFSSETKTALSLVEEMPRVMQLFTLQGNHALQLVQQRLAVLNTKAEGTSTVVLSPPKRSANTRAGVTPQQQHQERAPVSPPARPAGLRSPPAPPTPPRQENTSTTTHSLMRQIAAEIHQALSSVASPPTIIGANVDNDATPDLVANTRPESPVNYTTARDSTPSTSVDISPEIQHERATWSPDTTGDETVESLESPPEHSSSASSTPVPSSENEEEQPSSSSNSHDRSPNTTTSDSAEAPNEAEEEGEGEGDDNLDENGSEASSADMDFDRAEDAMKEEVECVEVTDNGQLMALLTARGRLTVLSLQARDAGAPRYEEKVLLDTLLPRMPQKRLQWYESLSSFVRFSPCHRFLLASVQFHVVHGKGPRGSLIRTQQDNAGEICVYSLHCEEDDKEINSEEREQNWVDKGGRYPPSRSESACNGTNNTMESTFARQVQQLLYHLPDRMYECFRPHKAACLSARWVDPRWWGGGRRSRWANSATEPLNTTTAAAAVAVRGAEGSSDNPNGSTTSRRAPSTDNLLPTAWRVAAAVLLSEYHCLSVGLDDRIVRWMPASGIVLQCILTEPVQDLLVSPLMAAFYVVSDAGDLYMYDAWDERDMGEVNSCSGSRNNGSGGDTLLSLWSNPHDACEHEAHPLMLPVTNDGHPCYYRTGAATQPYSGAAASHRLSRRRGLANEESNDTNDNNIIDGDLSVGGGFEDEVHRTRHLVHYTGPVTPVFQRVIEPVEKRRQRMQITQGGNARYRSSTRRYGAQMNHGEENEGDSAAQKRHRETVEKAFFGGRDGSAPHRGGLPRSLRWLLPHRWMAHSPWDAQLGRRLISHLLRRSSAPISTGEGHLSYEREEEGNEGGDVGQANETGLLLHRSHSNRNHTSGLHNEQVEAEDAASHYSSDFTPVDEEEDEQMWEYDYTTSAHVEDDSGRPPRLSCVSLNGNNNDDVVSAAAAAAARDTPVAVCECASHPTPARGTLRRAYYPSGACLVYRCVAQALCAAGDLADRQRDKEMGPGGFTHHLLSFAISGEPRWTAKQRLLHHNESGECDNTYLASAHHDGSTNAAPLASGMAVPSPPPTHWSTAALARVILWKNRLSTLRHLDRVSLDAWAQWEGKVLATSFHADTPSKTIISVAWSASQLLAARGFVQARDAWRRGAPAAQRGLAVTARNGRYLCLMATVGPYRKLANSREPLQEMEGFYASVVFDVYAGTVVRVIPVCSVDPSGLQGLNMLTSPQHDMDPKMPLYRLQCSVTIVPVVAAATNDAVGNVEDADGTPGEAVEPQEIVVLTVGGLANTVYVFDALNGRRIVCSRDVERECGMSAAAAYQASQAARTSVTSTAVTAAKKISAVAEKQHYTNGIKLQKNGDDTLPVCSLATISPAFTGPSPLLPPSIRNPADVFASITTWGRATGFDGITDLPSSSPHSSSPTPSVDFLDSPRARSTVNGGAIVTPLNTVRDAAASSLHSPPDLYSGDTQSQSESHVNAGLEAPRHAVQDAVLRVSGSAPCLLQGYKSASAEEWDLRGVLNLFHQQQRQKGHHATSAADPYCAKSVGGGATVELDDSNSDSEWKVAEGADVWEWHMSHGCNEGGTGDGGNVPSISVEMRGSKGKANGATTHDSTPRKKNGSAASPTSSLLSLYKALLGGTPSNLNADKSNALDDSAVSASVQHGAVWREQRRRLLERVLRHCDVGLLWQAYVALFASSTTAIGTLAPQSAVAALVRWAQQTTLNAAAVAAMNRSAGSVLSTAQSWVWCASRRRSSATDLITDPSETLRNDDEEECSWTGCTMQDRNDDKINNDDSHKSVPFARVLQQREELMQELQELEEAKQTTVSTTTATSATHSDRTQPSPLRASSSPPLPSLLTQMRTQAVLDGSLPLSAKLLHDQQRDATAASTATVLSSKTFPPFHHQNQMRLDVVNAVATWMDVNGGFYVCFGSEDGGLYLLGGNVNA